MMQALTSLLYPLKYNYPIISLLKKPDSLSDDENYNNSEMETFNSPMQIVMGIS